MLWGETGDIYQVNQPTNFQQDFLIEKQYMLIFFLPNLVC